MSIRKQDIVGTTIADRYEIVKQIGRGSMGTVYEARHTVIGRRFAIKVLNQHNALLRTGERFYHEARAAGAISHQHIVQVLDFGLISSGYPFLVMEYVDGFDLQAHMDQRGPLSVEDAVEICCQLLSALEVIHGAGLVHRDVKPANIMLVRGRRPPLYIQLLDFGIARAVNRSWHRPDMTCADQIMGTPAYLSPEQANGNEVHASWDLWAAGIILYEMLCGKLPFGLESQIQLMADILRCNLTPLDKQGMEFPPWLLQIQARALHPDVTRRYRSATTFLEALEQRSATLGGQDDPGEVKTSPFFRVDLDTPPPELMEQLNRSGQTPRPSTLRSTAHLPLFADQGGVKPGSGAPVFPAIPPEKPTTIRRSRPVHYEDSLAIEEPELDELPTVMRDSGAPSAISTTGLTPGPEFVNAKIEGQNTGSSGRFSWQTIFAMILVAISVLIIMVVLLVGD